MKSLKEHKQEKAVKVNARTGREVMFWQDGDGVSVDTREREVFVSAEGEVKEYFPHHYSNNTHYMEYVRG